MRNLSKAVAFLACGLAACGDQPNDEMAVSGVSIQAAAPTSGVSVTSSIADADASIAPALQIKSDGLGVYRPSSTISSGIDGLGAWVLDFTSTKNSTRTLYVNFSQPIAGSGPNGGDPVAIPSGLYKVHMISKCNLYNTNPLTMAPGTSMICPLHIGQIGYGGATYAVQMNPYENAGGVAYPDTDPATITCVNPTSGSGPCTAWRFTPTRSYTAPDGSVQLRNVGKLLKQVTSRGTTQSIDLGNFYFSFAFGLTNP